MSHANQQPLAKLLLALGLVGILLVAHAIIRSPDRDKTMTKEDIRYNRLQHEKSPYLLQHASNPVDWYPWGVEAFQKAKAEDKPIFLSIGYSTCHWCHVMEHESFEDSSVAELMNAAFINIKVDREERPDIDDIYMTVCQMLNNSGGWPLTIIMTPDKEPFFAATYIPKESRYQRPGMLDLIPRISSVWNNERERLLQSASQITEHLSRTSSGPPGEQLDLTLLDTTWQQLRQTYEPEFGGFGQSPKFPTPHNLMFLLRHYHRHEDPEALSMVENTLQAMRKGGIFDHVGFGFHRYSTDREWLVPHFEKMLYDQAILAMAYTEAWQITGKEEYAETTREIYRYILRDMTDSSGGFYSAEDADSEGEEGKFYVWSLAELKEVLGDDDAALYARIYNFTEEGNFLEEATRERLGTNIPHLKDNPTDIAAELGQAPKQVLKRLELARQKLFEVREKRIHPLKDDKILSDWNGLMIAALAKSAAAFDEPEYMEAAKKAADFVLNEMRADNGRLLHRYRDGELAIDAFLDNYAFMIWGLIELYQVTFEPRYLSSAIHFAEIAIKHFWDTGNSGFFFTADDAEELLVRRKDIYDGAIPSGNSVMMYNLVRLSRMTGKTLYEDYAMHLGKAFSSQVSRYPAAYTLLMLALDFSRGPSHEVVIAGEHSDASTKAMLKALNRPYLPNKVVLLADGNKEIELLAPFTEYMTREGDPATAYVCQNFACKLPTSDIRKMLELLR